MKTEKKTEAKLDRSSEPAGTGKMSPGQKTKKSVMDSLSESCGPDSGRFRLKNIFNIFSAKSPPHAPGFHLFDTLFRAWDTPEVFPQHPGAGGADEGRR
jgi:hypothetical protein